MVAVFKDHPADLGLTEKEIKRRLAKYGRNELPRKPQTSDLKILFEQFKSPLIYILLFAGLVTFFLKDFTDTGVIMAAVVINTILGFYQERKAERALEALKEFLHPTATVMREGRRQEVPLEEIVPGDVVLLAAGDKIPADGRVVEAYSLTINEAILTGESMAVQKFKIPASPAGGQNSKFKNTPHQNKFGAGQASQKSKVYMGTTVAGGRGVMVVEKTGVGTEMGKIAASISEQKEEKTPLQQKVAGLARWLAIMVGGIAAGVFIIGVVRQQNPLEMFTVAVAVAVAAIPEGLIVALTVILAIGMQRIFKRKALVRKLVAAETLGSVTVVASDKTGTLTEGKMRVVRAEFTNEDQGLRAAFFANAEEDPLEIALMDWVIKGPSFYKIKGLGLKKGWEQPFDPEKKYQAVMVAEKSGSRKVYLSGAPEVVLGMCKMGRKEREKWEKNIDMWASEGLRIVGFAARPLKADYSFHEESAWRPRELCWLGIVGIEDPVREEVVETLEKMHQAGIRLKIITGDYLGTAVAIWNKIKSKSKILERAYKEEKYVVGADLSDVERTTVFARVTPQEKLRIVKALQGAGEVVAIFGDGVNDAPALKAGDIGVVVNEAADTAKETADMVLLDSNFTTVVAAIEEGRGIYDNIKKVALYLLSDSFSEIVLVVLALLFGIPIPLTAAQILWINLITDGFPNLALTIEPKDKDLLKRKPLDTKKSLLDEEIKLLIAVISLATGIISFAIFVWFWKTTGNIALARSATFAALGIDSLLYVFSVRSLSRPLWKIPFWSNPYLVAAVAGGFVLQLVSLYIPFFQRFLETVALGLGEWSIILGASLLVIVLIEGIKYSYSKS